MVGADLSGIELRMLAHYLARYDEGRYASILLHGDIHQENADKIGISRRQVKTVTYAFLYGAGDNKIGLSYVVLALVAGLDVIRLFFNLILYIVIGGVILSWVAPGSDHPINKLIEEISFKVLMPIRKFIPSMGGLDISPIFVLIFLQQLDYFFYAIRMSLL